MRRLTARVDPPQVARVIPDSRLLILPRVGHVAQMEVPRLVARGIVGMLSDIATEDPP